MTYQNQLHPWCIVKQLPEMKRVVVQRYRRYQDADARARFLREQAPQTQFLIMFSPSPAAVAEATS